MSKLLIKFIAPCILLLIGYPSLVAAQTATATLSGTVADANGAAIPGAAITIEDPSRGVRRSTETNDSGAFTLNFLAPSNYTLTVAREGFATAQVQNVILNVGDQKSISVELKITPIKNEVIVTPEASLVDDSTGQGVVIDRGFAGNIPLSGGSFQSLIALTPGVVTIPVTGSSAGQFSVNGQRGTSNGFLLDGVSANNGVTTRFGDSGTAGNLPGVTALGTTQSMVSVDALQEFKVLTSGYAAEYGRQPGGQISMATRSGGNDIHGTAFNYVRNEFFDANDWFANRSGAARPATRQNNFGGTLSGPIFLPNFGDGGTGWYDGRKRSFFFFSYEGMRLQLPKFSLTNVPSLCLRGLGGCPAGLTAAPAVMLPMLNASPLPNGRELTNRFAEFAATYSDPSSLDATGVRVDHHFSEKWSVFGRFSDSPSERTSRAEGANLSMVTRSRLRTRSFTAALTGVLSKNSTNDLRVNISRSSAGANTALDGFGGAVPVNRQVHILSQFDQQYASGGVQFLLAGRTTALSQGYSFNNSLTYQSQFNLLDTFSYAIGSHQLKAGFDYRRLTSFGSGGYSMSATFSTVAQITSATAGTGGVGSRADREPIFTNFSAFLQDTWRPTRRLTLDLGVRWEVNPAPGEQNGLDSSAVTQIDDPRTMAIAPLGTPVYATTYGNFAPRFGISYLLFNKPGSETVVRGGFGVFYDTGNDAGGQEFADGPFRSNKPLTNLAFPISAAQAAPAPLGAIPSLTTLTDPELALPYTLQWNAAVERSLGADQSLSVSYVGAAGRQLLQGRRISLAGTGSPFTRVDLVTNNARSNYNALQATFQRRLSRGLQAIASYTWGHSLDDDSESRSVRLAQYGNSDFDVRHAASGAVTWAVPVPESHPSADALLRGWSLDSIVRVQSALPLDPAVLGGFDPVTGESLSGRPNLIPGVPIYLFGDEYAGGRVINNATPTSAQVAAAGCQSLNGTVANPTPTNARGAFCTPLAGQSGNFGRNQLRGYPAWQIDLSLRREIKFGERIKLQLRAEAFNLLNTPNFGAVQTGLESANFGNATNMLNRRLGGLNQLYQLGGPRSMQFAAKILF